MTGTADDQPGLLDWRQARDSGVSLAAPVDGDEVLALVHAVGRVTATSCLSPVALPIFDNSAMDGFVFRAEDLQGPGPWCLPVAGRIAAGEPAGVLPPGAAIRILTGAPIPQGGDTVVMQEHVERDDHAITLARRPVRGANIRRAGEDLSVGGEVLPAGRELGPRELGVLAATGQARVRVRRQVRVALLCSGTELREPGTDLAPGEIWNANRYLLTAAMSAPWIDLRDLGAVPDHPEALARALNDAALRADLVVSTGGMSDGDEDHMPRLLRAAGCAVHALRVAIKPGKPVSLGRLGRAAYVGLPGNPVAAFVTWAMLGSPMLRRLGGLSDLHPSFRAARLSAAVVRQPGRSEFRPARLLFTGPDSLPVVELMTPSYAARIALLARADGLALIPGEAERLPEGQQIDFLQF